MKDAIDASLDHLLPWMPWAQGEPQSLDEKIALLRGFRARFDAGEDFSYGIFSSDESGALGGTGLHPRVGAGAFMIGYWIRSSAVGRGLATEVAAALTRVAFAVCEAERVEIHVDPENEASRAIPRKLGYVEEARLRRRLPPRVPGGIRPDVLIYSMLVEEFAGSAASARSEAISAFDGIGRRLL